MSEWWTYQLSDFLMFAPSTYWRLMELYNRAFWPLQLLALLAGGAALWLASLQRPAAGRSLVLLLAVLWLWVGWAFHYQRYASINLLAPSAAAAFALQGLLLLGACLWPQRSLWLQRRWGAKPGIVRQGLGGLLAGVGLLYPLVGLLAGRPLWQVEVFGLAPEPTALVTLGLLLLSPYLVARTGRWLLLVIPALSLLLGAATHWTFLV
jgi:hypothetical protein